MNMAALSHSFVTALKLSFTDAGLCQGNNGATRCGHTTKNTAVDRAILWTERCPSKGEPVTLKSGRKRMQTWQRIA